MGLEPILLLRKRILSALRATNFATRPEKLKTVQNIKCPVFLEFAIRQI